MTKVAIAPVFVLFLNVRGFFKEIIKLKGQGTYLYYFCVSVVCIKLRVLARILGDTVLLTC